MKKEILLIILTPLILTLVIAQELNQTLEEQQELYTENAMGIFYLILIVTLIAITSIILALILPRIKEYT